MYYIYKYCVLYLYTKLCVYRYYGAGRAPGRRTKLKKRLCVYIHIYIYIYIYVYMCVCIYIYIYTCILISSSG